MSSERGHCEAVARAFGPCGETWDDTVALRRDLADLIMRERAGLLARAELAERDLAYEKAKVLLAVDGANDLRAKLAAAEARDIGNLIAERNAACAAAEQAEAAAGQLRRALELVYRDGSRTIMKCCDRYEHFIPHEHWMLMAAALATDADRGYLSPEQVARERAAARAEALEEAAAHLRRQALFAREQDFLADDVDLDRYADEIVMLAGAAQAAPGLAAVIAACRDAPNGVRGPFCEKPAGHEGNHRGDFGTATYEWIQGLK